VRKRSCKALVLRPGLCFIPTMNTMPDLNVQMKDDEIIVTQSSFDFVAIYKRANTSLN
jgi:hypothetical protein